MAVRNDLVVDWGVSPRIITVLLPSTEITIQDLHDTCRAIEATPEAMNDAILIDTAGLENLGGGTKVGLTSTLQNALLAFEVRLGPEYIQCNVTGGNVVAIDDLGASFLTPIHPTAFTQIVVTASSSATQSNQADLEYASFGDVVSVDADNGSDTNRGNKEYPVLTMHRAVEVAIDRGFDEIYVINSMSIGLGDDITNFKLTGRHPVQVIIDFMPDAITNGVTVTNATLAGTLDGDTIIKQCHIGTLEYVNGFITESVLGVGTIYLGGYSKASFNNCVSDVAGEATPTIDLGVTGQSLIMRNYSGGIALVNRNGNDPISIDLASGQVKMGNTFAGGDDVRIAGAGRIKNDGSTVNYDDSGLVSGTVTIGSQGFVVVNLSSSHSGTTYPVGTIPYPVNNINDAIALAQKNSVNTFKGIGLLTINDPYTIDNARFIGVSINQSSIEFGSNLTFDYLTCEDMHISGTCTGSLDTHRCEHHNLQNYVGNAWSGSFLGGFDYTFATGLTILYEPVFIGNETTPVVFDLSTTGVVLAIERGSGGIKITSLSGDDTLYLHMLSGSIELDSTCTGTIKLFGSAVLVDNTITATVEDNMLHAESVEEILNLVNHITKDVFIDTDAASNGDGSQKYPFDNLTDGIDHAEFEGIKELTVYSEITIDRKLKNFVVHGVGTPVVECNDQILDKSEFNHVQLRGGYTGSITAQDCLLAGTNTTLNGFFENCALGSSFEVPDGGVALVKNSTAMVPDFTKPIISIGGVAGTAKLSLMGYTGGITITNCTQASDNVKVIGIGIVELDASCTGGFITIIGTVKPDDNSGVGCTVKWLNIDPDELADMWDADYNKRETTSSLITLYERDAVTVKKTFNTDTNITYIDPV